MPLLRRGSTGRDQTMPGRLRNSLQRTVRTFFLFVRHHKIISAIIAVCVLALIVASFIAGIVHFNTVRDAQPLSTNPAIRSYQIKLADLEKAATSNEKDANAQREYAVALFATRDYAAAVSQYEKLVGLRPQDASIRNNLGNAYRENGQADKAIAAYEKALELDDKNVNAYSNLANLQLYKMNDSASAITTYKRAVAKLPNNSEMEVLLAVAYERSGQKSLALQTYRHILMYDANNAAAIDGEKRTEA